MEHIRTPKVENVKMLDRFNTKASPLGKLYVTTSHLIFIQDMDGKETWILHMLMNQIDKPLLTTSGSQLKISCSNFRTVTFTIQRDRDAHDVYQSLLELSKPATIPQLYCFSYNPNKGELRQDTGWNFHDVQAEFQRQGVNGSNWSCCTLNKDYGLCPTYPKYLYVPNTASREIIEGSAKFRSRGRLPVLSYLHTNGAALIRCAQPLVGMSGVRSVHDEQYVECLRRAAAGHRSHPAAPIHIVDTRPAVNAMANKAGGKGYESDKFYNNINFSFKGIENIHKMRASLKHLVNSVSTCNTIDLFRTELANSGWLKHVKAVLDVSLSIARTIDPAGAGSGGGSGSEAGSSVIVHCSDGWDRTSQTCALAGLVLDGYYRTIHGFQALIEKDWLSFGHKFNDRCGHVQGDAQEVSPTFIQFLDCVWQLTQMFPTMFQFNERYLVTIAEHVYSCQYGTFIGNSCKQREELCLKEKTYSLWGYLAVSFSQDDQFVNPLYDKETSKQVIRFKGNGTIVPQNINFWRGLYCQFESGAHPREPLLDLLSITQNHTTSLEDHGRQLTKTIGYYTEKIGAAKMLRNLMQNPTLAAQQQQQQPTAAAAAAAATASSSGGSYRNSNSSWHPLSEDYDVVAENPFVTVVDGIPPAAEQTSSLPSSAAEVTSSSRIEDAEEALPATSDERHYAMAELVPERGLAAHRVTSVSGMSHPLEEVDAAAAPSSSSSAASQLMSHPLMAETATAASSSNNDFDQIEKKFSTLKTSLVEKCQSSM